MNDLEQLAKELRGCSVVLEIDSISHLETHNCFLVNDTFLLSYGQAKDIHRRSRAASWATSKASGLAERLVGWVLQAIYRCCFASQKPAQMKKEPVDGEQAVPQS